MNENTVRTLLDENLTQTVVGGYSRGKKISKYNIRKGKMYYIWDYQSQDYQLAMAASDNYDDREEFFGIPAFWTRTRADLMWVAGPQAGRLIIGFEFCNMSETIYEAVA